MDFQYVTTWNSSYNAAIEKYLKTTLEQKLGHSLIFEPGALYVLQEERCIGGIVFEIQDKAIWIDSLGVDPLFQCQGIGTRLIEQLAKIGKEQGCSTLQLNTYFAQGFFQKVNFAIVAIIPRWKYGLDCYFMQRII